MIDLEKYSTTQHPLHFATKLRNYVDGNSHNFLHNRIIVYLAVIPLGKNRKANKLRIPNNNYYRECHFSRIRYNYRTRERKEIHCIPAVRKNPIQSEISKNADAAQIQIIIHLSNDCFLWFVDP